MAKYEQYYTSSDCSVFIESEQGSELILLDKLKSVGFSENLSSEPIYGIGNSKFGFISQGNILVNGALELNFIDPNYLYKTLQFINSSPVGVPVDDTLAGYTALSDEALLRARKFKVQQDKAGNRQFNHNISDYPTCNIRIVMNNSYLYREDKDRIILLRGVKFIGTTMPVSISSEENVYVQYTFLAREASREGD